GRPRAGSSNRGPAVMGRDRAVTVARFLKCKAPTRGPALIGCAVSDECYDRANGTVAVTVLPVLMSRALKSTVMTPGVRVMPALISMFLLSFMPREVRLKTMPPPRFWPTATPEKLAFDVIAPS